MKILTGYISASGGQASVAGHDVLMALMMFRAQNVRASMQEEELASSRGVLSSPSQQK